MIKEITMPAGGQTTDTSTIGTWLVKKGDKVNRGDALLEIETDKATLTVESFAKGTVLAVLVEEGDTASAGDVIAYIGNESDMAEAEARLNGGSAKAKSAVPAVNETETVNDSEVEEYQPIDKSKPRRYASDAAKEQSAATAVSTKVPEHIKAMPNAKLLARKEQVRLEDVAAYLGKEIIKRADVRTYLDEGAKAEQPCVPSQDTLVPLTTMRKVIAKRMLESTQNIPVFQATVEVDMTQCIALRKKINDNKDGLKVSFNDILFKCMEAAIRKYPYVNASYTDTDIVLHSDVNIGLAVSVDQGLVVPVVKGVQSKNIADISAVNKSNIEKARAGKLTPDEMSGGTVTLSNLGMYPITTFSAIINPPEVCILAIGATVEKPVFVNGEWKAVPTMNITGSFDHRVIDGAYGAEFLAALKKIIENPALALL